MKTKLHYVLSLTIFLFVFSAFAQKKHFTKVSSQRVTNKSANPISTDTDDLEHIFQFNYDQLSKVLLNAPERNESSKSSGLVMSFPNEDGTFENYKILESSVMHPDLQAKYPEIRSYVGYGVDSPSSYMRFSLSPQKGLSAIVLGKKDAVVFEPQPSNSNQVKVSKKSNLYESDVFSCKTLSTIAKTTSKSSGLKDADDSLKRTYRLALSVTGEYAVYHGGTLPLVNAAIVASLNNITAVFENDLNVSMQLIATNDNVIYLNPATDPYTSYTNYNSQLASTLDTQILEANYDIGHLLGGVNDNDGNPTGDSGCIGCVCNNGGSVGSNNHKGSAFTTGTAPSGINFDIDFIAHEMGHQFGGTHTWTHNGAEVYNAQMEPGSGSTLMGYAGITGSTNVQLHSSPYFHAISIQQITTYVKGTACPTATVVNTGNTTPTANAGSNLTLPVGTAFKLVGSGSDVDGDTVTFCWEQMNEDNAATTYPNPNSTNSNSVLFRSYSPTTDNTRYFPNLSDLRFGVNATQWEKVPNVNRTADFRLTVRDNRTGGANNTHDDMQVTFNNSYGPFVVTSQNTTGILWNNGTTKTITWNVNNTNALTGASNVNILLSTDGGLTYGTTLASNVPNNGSANITVPNTPAPRCRIMIEPTNHNFFAINSEDFAIDYTVNTTCTQYSSAASLGIGITDNGGSYTQSHVINVPTSSTISDVNVGMDISHSYIGDLGIAVLSPDGTEITLKTRRDCDSEVNLIGTYDDSSVTYNCLNASSNISQQSVNDLLSGLNGENTSGDWTIRLGDFAPSDTGTLNSWFVEVCTTTETPLSSTEFAYDSLKVFPNPSEGAFTIKLSNLSSDHVNVAVYDLRGRTIYNTTYETVDELSEEISLDHAQSGMYLLSVNDGKRSSIKKIIIE